MIEQDFQINYSNLSEYSESSFEQEPIEIIGLVSPIHQGGTYRGNNCKIHQFSFFAWRKVTDSNIKIEKINIFRPVRFNKSNYLEDIPKLSVIRCKIFINNKIKAAIFVDGEILNNNEDFQDIIDKLNEPVELETPQFGVLTLNKAIGYFSGETEWLNNLIELSFVDLGKETHSEFLNAAEVLFASQSEWNDKLIEYAKNELLDIKNEHWLEEDEKEVTPEEFKNSLKLKAVTLDRNGQFVFSFDDGDLFCGHIISVYGSLENGIEGASI